MKIAVIGTGYVGLVTGTCFAEMGNDVICVDNNKEKIETLRNGGIPIYEPGLENMVKKNYKAGRLKFTSDIKDAVEKSLFCFIAVGTPPDEDGSADLQHVLAVAEDIAKYMNGYKIVVDKSTVPVGTADKVRNLMKEHLKKEGKSHEFDVVSNPEFLKEGAAVNDFMKPDRVVIGTENVRVAELLKELYAPFNRTRDRVIVMSVRSAEMTKYTANSMLATKISFMNEIANLCEVMGADVNEVRQGIGSDTRIGYHFIYPGVGYGGSCFPKDVKALINMAKKNNIDPKILNSVEDVNKYQKRVLVDKVKKHFGNDLTGKTFALWGLSFKPETDDMREAPSIEIIDGLTKAGAQISAYDPQAIDEAKRIFGKNNKISYKNDNYTCLKNADALILVTEWHSFRRPNFKKIADLLKQPVIFDGRNIFDPSELRELDFTYYGIGRK